MKITKSIPVSSDYKKELISSFKDKCDVCGKWDYCSGFKDLKVLCNACLEKEKERLQKEDKKI